MIRSLKLRNFKAFERFDVSFPETAVLIGPNNAGKSTVISALRAVATMTRTARRRRAPSFDRAARIPRGTFPLVGAAVGIEDENLRHEFRVERETSLEARFAGGGVLRAVWPDEDSDINPHFSISLKGGDPPRSLEQVREAFPPMGTIPVLTPLDHRERLLSAEYVQANLGSRLASRHFRNQMLALERLPSEEEFDLLEEFLVFAEHWLPEVPMERPSRTSDGDNTYINVFYKEGRTPKELVWAGDGVQVFIQLLLHFFRLRDSSVIVLDEPDVYLHADLQRRVIRLLAEVEGQVILATHSPEILVEAPAVAGVLIEVNGSRCESQIQSSRPTLIERLGPRSIFALRRSCESASQSS